MRVIQNLSKKIVFPGMKQNQHFNSIQYMRGVAALLVVYAHAAGNWISRFDLSLNREIWLLPGEIGVWVFFAISGFIIDRSSGRLSGATGAIEFAKRRFIRVVPLYWFFTVVYTAKLFMQGKGPSLSEFLLSVGFVPYLNADGFFRPIHQVGWTLNYEVYFYFLFGLSICFFSGVGRIVFVCALLMLVYFADVPFYGSPIIFFFLMGAVVSRVNLLKPSPHRQGVLNGFLHSLGDASYSTYLAHPFVLGSLNFLLWRLEDPGILEGVLYFSAAMILSALAGYFCHIWLERPLIAKASAWISSARSKAGKLSS